MVHNALLHLLHVAVAPLLRENRYAAGTPATHGGECYHVEISLAPGVVHMHQYLGGAEGSSRTTNGIIIQFPCSSNRIKSRLGERIMKKSGNYPSHITSHSGGDASFITCAFAQ